MKTPIPTERSHKAVAVATGALVLLGALPILSTAAAQDDDPERAWVASTTHPKPPPKPDPKPKPNPDPMPDPHPDPTPDPTPEPLPNPPPSPDPTPDPIPGPPT